MVNNDIGRQLKIIRINRGDTAKVMAEKFDMSIAYLYAIESGARAVPQGFFELINNNYELTDTEQSSLNAAIINSTGKAKIDMTDMSRDRKELMIKIASGEINEATIKEMRMLLSNK